MSDRRYDSTAPRRWPWGLIGMLVLVALVEVGLDAHGPDLIAESPHNWWWSGWASTRPYATKAEILAFGDSMVKHGVAPKVVETQTGLSMWNLAVSAGRPVHSYHLLRRALAAGAQPKAIVLDAEVLTWEPLEHPAIWAHLIQPREALEMAWLGRDPHFLASYGLAWLLPSVRSRWEIRDVVRAHCRGTSTHHRAFAAIKDRHWKANHGATIFPADQKLDPASVVGVDTYPPDKPLPGQWEPKPVNVVYLDRLLDLADRRQIPVFWLIPPRYSMYARMFERPNWNGLQRQFMQERLARHRNLTVIDGLASDYGREVVVDVAHLNRGGAVAYSLTLGQILRDCLAGPMPADLPSRWIPLPPYTDPPIEALVEDTNQSAVALHAEHAAKLAAEAQAKAQTQARR